MYDVDGNGSIDLEEMERWINVFKGTKNVISNVSSLRFAAEPFKTLPRFPAKENFPEKKCEIFAKRFPHHFARNPF